MTIDDLPDEDRAAEFQFDGKDGAPVSQADIDETVATIRLGEEVEG